MPLDLRALVRETIAREEKELDERLAAAKRQQQKAEQAVAEQLLLLQYVEEDVAKDPALAKTWSGLALADVLRDGQKVLADRSSSDASSERPAPLGLTPEEVLPSETEVKEFQEAIIPRVARRIEEDRDKLLRFCQPKSQIQSTISPSPLCDAIEDLFSRLTIQKRQLEEEEEKKEEMLTALARIFNDLLSKMLLLLHESYPIVMQQQVLEIRQNLSRFKCMDLKAKATHLSLMSHIYTPKKIQGLMDVKYSLNRKIVEVEKEYAKWSSAIRAFDAVEPEFLEVVKEFESVLDAIKTHEYILKEYSS